MKAVATLPDLYAGMNGLEKSRAIELEALKRTGQIVAWHFERLTLKLADDTRYTPDFLVIHPDGAIHLEETKGFWRDDAKVKIKVAAEQFPYFTFRSFVRDGARWITKEF